MRSLIDVYYELYLQINDYCKYIQVNGKKWYYNEYKYIFQYDILRICSVVYLISDEDRRKDIRYRLNKIFDIIEPEKNIIECIESFDSNDFLKEMFISFPYFVSLAYIAENFKETLAGLFLLLEQAYSRVILWEDRDITETEFAFVASYFTCCENRLENKGIANKAYAIQNVLGFKLDDIFKKCEKIETYEPIESLDKNKLDELFNTINTAICDGTISDIVNSSKNENVYMDLSREKIEEIIAFFSSSVKNDRLREISHTHNRMSELKFDENVLPQKYSHFRSKEVNENNIDELFEQLDEIEKKYRDGLFDLSNKFCYRANDWESECYYEQAKYIEGIIWTGDEVDYQCFCKTYTTIRSCTEIHLKYYLYWRTALFNGTIYRSDDSYLLLCMYELIAGIGDFSKRERVKLLERLMEADELNHKLTDKKKSNYRRFSVRCEQALVKYEKMNNLIDMENLFSGDSTKWRLEWDYCAQEIIDGDYTHIVEMMEKISPYKFREGALISKVPCENNIVECIKSCIPHVENVLNSCGFSLAEILVGKIVPFSCKRIEEALVLTDRVQARLFDELEPNAIDTLLEFREYPLAEYIIKFVENSFRKYFNKGDALYPCRPFYFEKNSSCNKDYQSYLRGLTYEQKKKGQILLSSYDRIDEELKKCIDAYFNKNALELIEIKDKYTNAKFTDADRMAIFEDTLTWIKSNRDLSSRANISRYETCVYDEDYYPLAIKRISHETIVKVTRNGTCKAIIELRKREPHGKIAFVNFANVYQPGGDVNRGGISQEATLCRITTLYPVLRNNSRCDIFYRWNNYHREKYVNAKATDAVIYSKDITICKTDEDFPKRLPKEKWVEADAITVATPCFDGRKSFEVKKTMFNEAEIFACHVKRALHILSIASFKHVDFLVIGLSGDEILENNMEVIARAYKVALKEFPEVFSYIEFALGSQLRDSKKYNEFKKVLRANEKGIIIEK